MAITSNKMKNSNTIVSIILGIAVVILFILHFTSNKGSKNQVGTPVASDSTLVRMPIAYINLDSLMVSYEYAKTLQEAWMTKMESSQATVNSKGRAVENEMKEFQRKIENNAFFDQSRAQREQERILKLQQEYQELNQRLSAELMQEEAIMNQQLRDSILHYVELYNQEIGKYQMIFTNNTRGDMILNADPAYDITAAVIKFLNDRYTPAAAEK